LLYRPAPRLSELLSVPTPLDDLVAQMLDKNLAERPADGRAAWAALSLLTTSDGALAAPTVLSASSAPGKRAGSASLLSSVAVLPFLDMSATRDQGYLCEGIAEELINTLAQVPGLRVAARSSSFAFRLADADARSIGRRLGVQAVLEGGVRKVGDRLRVTVQLVDVADGSPRWSHRFDGSIDEVFEVQDQIAASVATALRGMLSSKELDALRRPGTRADAYEHFLRGRQLFRSLTLVSAEAAEREFRQALELDPGYAPAHAGLAQIHAWRVEWMGGSTADLDAADHASRQALQSGPELAESHVARGDVLSVMKDHLGAEREYQEAIRLNPSSYDAYYRHARLAFQSGEFEKSITLFRRGAEVRPDDFQCLALAEMPLRRVGRPDEARASQLEALRRIERQLEIDPNDSRALTFAAGILVQVDRARALELAARAVAVAPDEPAVLGNIACMYTRIGMNEEALKLLAQTFGRGIGNRAWVENDPDYDPLRGDPRFQVMMAKLPR
jgi:non-specific serine/threonine protein kinase